MFINKLNQLYKPKRILYYQEITKEEIRDFHRGIVPEAVANYSRAFGTYDYPGIFSVKALGREVLGIEFRIDDDRIDYPKDMEFVVLEASFFYSIEIDDETKAEWDSVQELFRQIAVDDDAHRIYTDMTVKKESEVTGIFYDDKKIRILYECQMDEDRARWIQDRSLDELDKELLCRMALTDPITGHYNWNYLVSYLEMPQDKGIDDFSFVHFDIKEFRVINEVYGHIAANRVLSNVVRAMKESDFVYASARCHNDNFAMMIRDMPEEETKKKLGEFFASLSRLEEDSAYRIFYRCGVVLMPRSLLMGNRVADAGKLAQSLGKDPNKTEIIIYTDEMHDAISWGNYIKAYVETAIEQDEFEVYLQPKIDLNTGEPEGAEALIRWNYKKKEFLPPSRFIPFFEKDGSIGRIDDIVLEKVCQALSRWKKEGKRVFPVSVNLSRCRMYGEGLIDHLASIVDRYGVDHKLIDFELTESATYDDMEHMIRILEDLRGRGFKISMDDFGTGYSSLSLLTEMPLDTLKIDKSFVDKVGTEKEREADVIVIRHIITLARELGFVCLAEGAETEEQVKRLKELGVEIIQGYYFSRPIPIREFEQKYI